MSYDIFFVSRNIVHTESWMRIKKKYPNAQRIDSVQSFEQVKSKSLTKMFWVIWDDVQLDDNFNLYDFKIPTWDQEYIHVFKNGNYFDGVYIFPKKIEFSNKEWNSRYFIFKKEIDIVVAYPRKLDIVFISYNEPDADKNYESLRNKITDQTLYRVNGVKGIHNAHKEAAKLVQTYKFWVVDADAQVVDDFKFEVEQIPYYSRQAYIEFEETVQVWRSKNSVNGLEYGNGGVKLLPTKLTINMDENSADMTTSISKKFKVMPEISNITAFNTDPFNTWKSAFRECVKLSSKIIKGQIDSETEHRLHIWCTEGADRPFGEYAIRGAIEGKKFGEDNKHNPANLSKINDFEWLIGQYRI